MNSVLLLAIAVAIFVFGYRFYAKLLAASLFRPADNYSTSTPPAAAHPPHAAGRYLDIGRHFASVGAFATWVGTAAAAGFGWAPAFLWIVAGAVLIGGVFGFSTLWLSPQKATIEQAVPPGVRLAFLGLVLALVLAMNAVLTLLIAGLLARYPGAAIPFWLQMPIALGLGVFLSGRERFELIPATLIALALSLTVIWLGPQAPFTMSGALHLQVGTIHFDLDGTAVWLALAFIYLHYEKRLRPPTLTRARAYLAAAHLGLLLIVSVAAIVALHPDLAAPNFAANTTMPSLPLLFALIGSGALGGVYVFAAARTTARALPSETAQMTGYGAALVDAGLAVIILLACTAAFTGEDWHQLYPSGAGLDLSQVFDISVRGVVVFGENLGLDPLFSQTFATIVALGLAVASIDAGLRLQASVIAAIRRDPDLAQSHDPIQRVSWWLPLVLALGLHVAGGIGVVGGWSALGGLSLSVAALALLLVGVILARQQRPHLPVLAPALFLAIIGNWVLVDRVIAWMSTGQWLGAGFSVAAMAAELWIVFEGIRVLSKERRLARTT